MEELKELYKMISKYEEVKAYDKALKPYLDHRYLSHWNDKVHQLKLKKEEAPESPRSSKGP